MKLEIKVCGNNNPKNLRGVCDLKPDYIVFIFYDKSKRFVQNTNAVGKNGSCKAKRVGVFVNASASYIMQVVNKFELDIIQLHGDESSDFCQEMSEIRPVFKAFQINSNFNYGILTHYKSACNKFLFDTASNMYGGSGKKFDWQLLDKYKLDIPFLLSGGIGPEDLPNIKVISHPMFSGIDLNSRFETTPGVKDIARLSTFINNIRKL